MMRGFQSREELNKSNFHSKQMDEKAQEKEQRVYVGFMDLEKVYDRLNRKARMAGVENI